MSDSNSRPSGPKHGQGLPQAPRAPPSSLHSISDRFFFWRSIGSMRGHNGRRGRIRHQRPAETSCACVSARPSPAPSASSSPTRTPRRCLTTSCSTSAASPDSSPAILCAIGHMQMEEGIWYPMGGTRAVPEAHGQARDRARRDLPHRAQTSPAYSRTLRRTVVRPRQRQGHRPGHHATISRPTVSTPIVSNSDAVRTYRELVRRPRRARLRPQAQATKPACSGVVLYLGLNKRYDHLAHHDFVFSRDAHEEFHHDLRSRASPRPIPTCYLAATAADRSLVSAPAGGEALYVLVHTRLTCARTTTGRRCSPPTARSSSTSSSAPQA